MRTTLNLDDDEVEKARELTGIQEKTALVHAGLKALISQATRERLAMLAGSQPQLRAVSRRRSKG
jgi:Arc/MetJ family transcription regulator